MASAGVVAKLGLLTGVVAKQGVQGLQGVWQGELE